MPDGSFGIPVENQTVDTHNTDKIGGDQPIGHESENRGSSHFNLMRSFGRLMHELPRIPLTDSAEKISYELQMNTTILIERRIAKSETVKKIPEGLIFRENPDRENPIDIVRRGIELYKSSNPDSILTYDTPDKRIGEIDFVHAVGRFIEQQGRLPSIDAELTDIFHTDPQIPTFARDLVIEADTKLSSDVPDSCQALFELFNSSELVTQEDLFSKALEISRGNIVEAVDLMSIFTKSIVRPTYKGMQGLTQIQYADRIRKKIKDQLSDYLPLQDLPEEEIVDTNRAPEKDFRGKDRTFPLFDYSVNGRLGAFYHLWEIIKLTKAFTPEMVRMMTMGEYNFHLEDHGHMKYLSDLRVLADLYKIVTLFKVVSTGHMDEQSQQANSRYSSRPG